VFKPEISRLPWKVNHSWYILDFTCYFCHFTEIELMARGHYFGGHFDSDIYFDYLKPNSLISAYPITNFVYK
jgi:hypothetical protein